MIATAHDDEKPLIEGAIYVPNGAHPSFRKACRVVFADLTVVKTRSHAKGVDGASVAKWDRRMFLSVYGLAAT